MQFYDKTLIQALGTSVKELQQNLETHCSLVAAFLKGQGDEHAQRGPVSVFHTRSREIDLENAIKEAIEVLEQSRKAFKSRQLEILRKKLTQVLIESPASQSWRNF